VKTGSGNSAQHLALADMDQRKLRVAGPEITERQEEKTGLGNSAARSDGRPG
jgi:hypothetical protein